MHARRFGFTLIELMIVLTLMAILFALVLTPKTDKPISLVSLRSSATALAHEIRAARQSAISREVHFRIRINTAAQTYDISEGDSTASVWTDVRTGIALLQNVQFQGTSLLDNVLIYDIKGIPYEGDQAPTDPLGNAIVSLETITLGVVTDGGTETSTLTLHPESGFVKTQN